MTDQSSSDPSPRSQADTWPECREIERARTREGYSVRFAAERAGIVESYWRKIVDGNWTVREGQAVRVPPKAETIAKMAVAVRLPSSVLARVGRQDAAELVRGIAARYAEGRDPIKEAIEADALLDDRAKATLAAVVDAVRSNSPNAEGNGDPAAVEG